MTGPTNKTLGQMLAEQSVALRRRHGFHRIPMPSDAAVIDRTVKLVAATATITPSRFHGNTETRIPPVNDSGQPLNRADARAQARMRRRLVGRALNR